MPTLAIIAGVVALIVAAQVVLKVGAVSLTALPDRPRGPLALASRALRVPGVLVGLILYALSALLWLAVLSRTPLSYAHPFLGLSYVGVAIASVLVLRERFSAIQWLGLVFVVFGVIAVAVSG